MNPTCHRCYHYYVTWEKGYPHGCHAMKFKSKRLPWVEVRFATRGQNCLAYKPKNYPKACKTASR